MPGRSSYKNRDTVVIKIKKRGRRKIFSATSLSFDELDILLSKKNVNKKKKILLIFREVRWILTQKAYSFTVNLVK